MLLLLACAAPDPSPTGGSGLIYEAYVRSFRDADGDGVGDLAGLRERLDHLASLHVSTLWLMPIFEAHGPAGYAVTDYDALSADYGDTTDLAALVADAHALGIDVVIDFPLNHVDDDHPWFQAAQAGDPARLPWFRYAPTAPAADRWWPLASGGAYYARFDPGMPDLDWTRPDVRAELLRVARAWLDAGVDGYRLDAVAMLVEDGDHTEDTPESRAAIAELRALTPDAHLLAEASVHDVATLGPWVDTGVDHVLDYPRLAAFDAAIATGRAAPLVALVQEEVNAGVAGASASFLGSHDLDRLATRVPDPPARRALRVAQLLLPGDPVLYYGEEIDLPDATTGTGQDWAMRAPMAWDNSELAGFSDERAWFTPDPSAAAGVNVTDEEADPASMLRLVQGLACLREAHDLGGDGSWEVLPAPPELLAFARGDLRVVVNLSDRTVADPLDGGDRGPYTWALEGDDTCEVPTS